MASSTRICSSKRRLLELWNLLVILTLAKNAISPVLCLGGLHKTVTLGEVTSTNPQSFKSENERPAELGFAVDLVRFHHWQHPNLTAQERALIAVKSSQARGAYFQSRIVKTSPRFAGKAVFNSPLYSNQGGYVMQIKLGTPAKTLVAIADTGSDLVWVQCQPCTRCFSQPDPVFNPAQSTSYSAISCTSPTCGNVISACGTGNSCVYRQAYGDQSTTQGVYSVETVTMTSAAATQSFPNFKFGCGTQNQGLFRAIDGLVGLGNGDISLVGQLGSQFGNVFSYCLAGYYSTKISSLVLGSAGGGVSYTPLVFNPVNPTFYYVNLQTILVNGNPLNIPAGAFAIDSSGGGGILIDSGTTLTMLQSAGYRPLLSALQSLITYPRIDGSSAGLDLCYDLSGVPNPTVPSVTFRFENVDVTLPDDNLFLQMDNVGDFCMAIVETTFGVGIFGNIQQQNFNIAFDKGAGQVGFAPKQC